MGQSCGNVKRMGVRWLRKLLLISTLLLPILCGAALGDGVGTLPDTLSMVEGYLKSVEDVQCTYITAYRTMINPEANSRQRSISFAWDRQGREMVVERTVADGRVKSEKSYSWDGELQKTATVDVGTDERVGVISPKRRDSIMASAENPVAACVEFLGVDTMSKLRQSKAELQAIERTGDNEFFVVKFWMVAPGSEERGDYYVVTFSRNQGFAPVKRIAIYGNKPWTEATIQLAEIRDGIWLPTQMKVRSYLTGEGKGDFKEGGITEALVDEKSYKINERLGNNIFNVQFQQGTRIIDEFAQLDYTLGEELTATGETSKKMLDSLVEQGKTIAVPEHGNERTREVEGVAAQRSWRLAIVVVALVLLIALVLLLLRRKKKLSEQA